MNKVNHFSCTSCHLEFEQNGEKITPALMFGLCPYCGEKIQENQLLTEADNIVNAVYSQDREPIIAVS